ncbi:MAG TPA: response regulator [Gammaproteobacteria bacterium]|jgi:two-component system OmpR family response regulator
MTKRDHILLVDDDAEIRALLSEYLTREGFAVTAVPDGRSMDEALEDTRFDIAVLDLMLPGEDGVSLCRRLRGRSILPIIMLTARGEEADRITGLEAGADDYLAKPFNPRELLARVHSVLRRARTLPEDVTPEQARRFKFSGWNLDTLTRQLVSPTSVVTPLSGAEYRLLSVFLHHAGEVLSRDQLTEMIRGRGSHMPFDRSIDVQVSRLRQRLGDDGRVPAFIRTVRGEGYVFAVPVEVQV